MIRQSTLALILVVVASVFVYGQGNPCSEGTAYRNCAACGTAQSFKGKKPDVVKKPRQCGIGTGRDHCDRNP